MLRKWFNSRAGFTTAYVITVALLIGLEIADYRMPAAWRETWTWSTVRSFSFSGPTVCFWLIFLGLGGIVLCLIWHEHFWPTPRDPCVHCRYDRTGLPTDAVCPECGKANRLL